MNLSHFFIDRPIFATVLSVFVILIGGAAYFTLPVAQYPEIAPPAVSVSASYPGASADVIESSVTTVIEQQMTGLRGLLFFNSSSSSSGSISINLAFENGTDVDIAAVE